MNENLISYVMNFFFFHLMRLITILVKANSENLMIQGLGENVFFDLFFSSYTNKKSILQVTQKTYSIVVC